MAFEREAIDTTTPNPVVDQSNPIMREERVISSSYKPKPIPEQMGQVDSAETVKPVVAEKPIEDTLKLSPQVAALAKREQKYRAQLQALENEKKSLAAEKAEIAQLKAMKEKLAAHDYSALDDMIDYNDYSNYQVNKLNGADPVQDEIKKLTNKISELEKTTQDNISKQFDAAVQERRHAVTELVTKTDTFPRIKKANATEAVVQHILDTWEEDSIELPIEQAAKEVEEILLEKAKKWADLLEEKKIEEPIEPVDEKKPLPQLKPSLKTLTNQVTTGDVKSSLVKPLHFMSDSERWAEARKRAEARLQTR